MSNEITGIIDQSAEDYHAAPGISASFLKSYMDCPEKAYAEYVDPNRVPKPQTAAMRFGSLVHLAALEPDVYAERVAVRPAGMDGRTKAGKEWAAENEGKEIVSADEGRDIGGIASKVRAIIPPGSVFEQSLYWTEDGHYCRARLDIIHDDTGWIYDLKTADNSSPGAFCNAIKRYNYDIQVAHYLAGYKACYGQPQGFRFIVVEKNNPYCMAIHEMERAWVEHAMFYRVKMLERVAKSFASGHWPGYPGSVLAMPNGRFDDDE